MDQQKCRLCGKRHRLGPCPALVREVTKAVDEIAPFRPPSIHIEVPDATAEDRAMRQSPPMQIHVIPAIAPTPTLSEADLCGMMASAIEDALTRVMNAAQKSVFDRRTYQREYMRKRRAAQKLAKEQK